MGISQTRRRAVYARDESRCRFFIGERVCGSRHDLTLHHVTACRNGGSDHEDNLVTVCYPHHAVIEKDEACRKRQRELWKAEGRLSQAGPRRRATVKPKLSGDAPPGHYFDLYMHSLAVRQRAAENFRAAWDATGG